MIVVRIPSPLHSYTGGRSQVQLDADSIAMLSERLDALFPGIRFRIIDERDRIRPHIQFFVNGEMVRDLAHPLAPADQVHIICALSGG
ncbi:MAG: MoaD/ThiS family protein [Candidatus Binataceae bacterium]